MTGRCQQQNPIREKVERVIRKEGAQESNKHILRLLSPIANLFICCAFRAAHTIVMARGDKMQQ